MDFSWSPNGIDGRWFDWNGLIAAADWAFVMGYDTQSQVHAHCNTAWLGSSEKALTSPTCWRGVASMCALTAADLGRVQGERQLPAGTGQGWCPAVPGAGHACVKAGPRRSLVRSENFERVDAHLRICGVRHDALVKQLHWNRRYAYQYQCERVVENICLIQPVPFRGCPCSDAAGREIDYADVVRRAYAVLLCKCLRRCHVPRS